MARRRLAVVAVATAIGGSKVPDSALSCWRSSWKWGSSAGSQASEVADTSACQAKCNATAGCAHFTFKSLHTMCELFTDNATVWPEPSTGSVAGSAAETCQRQCAGPSARASSSRARFPGGNASATHQAFASGYQPSSLECWPKSADKGKYFPCADFTVLLDTKQGWPGTCRGLTAVDLPKGQTCEAACMGNPFCPGYQLAADGACWQGLGYNCNDEGARDFEIRRAARIQHGSVRVLANLTGFKVQGLRRLFGSEASSKRGRLSAARACRYACYASLWCQYWQLLVDNSCWIEDISQSHAVAYPLTTEAVLVDQVNVSAVYFGEYIQHACLSPVSAFVMPTTTTSTTTTSTTTTLTTASIQVVRDAGGTTVAAASEGVGSTPTTNSNMTALAVNSTTSMVSTTSSTSLEMFPESRRKSRPVFLGGILAVGVVCVGCGLFGVSRLLCPERRSGCNGPPDGTSDEDVAYTGPGKAERYSGTGPAYLPVSGA